MASAAYRVQHDRRQPLIGARYNSYRIALYGLVSVHVPTDRIRKPLPEGQEGTRERMAGQVRRRTLINGHPSDAYLMQTEKVGLRNQPRSKSNEGLISTLTNFY